MSTETAKVTGAVQSRNKAKGEDFIDVEVTFTLGRGESKVEEVLRYGYPIDVTPEAVEADIAKALETRKAEREQAEVQEAQEAEAAKADEAVAALEGMKVTP